VARDYRSFHWNLLVARVVYSLLMPLLFSYGTLQDPAVQIATFGRLLAGERDSLIGFAAGTVTRSNSDGVSTYQNASYSGDDLDRVPGTVFDVADHELEAADAYERGADYVRVRARLVSGLAAWVYVHAASAPSDPLKA
jgi:gamma-glutamylcyclotransferase (GGCT)/AIG2-like uncharacterized protein YtfP